MNRQLLGNKMDKRMNFKILNLKFIDRFSPETALISTRTKNCLVFSAIRPGFKYHQRYKLEILSLPLRAPMCRAPSNDDLPPGQSTSS